MSYQPDPPAGAQPSSPFAVPPGPPPPPPPTAAAQYSYGTVPATTPVPERGKRRKGLLFTGIAIAALGIGAGIVMVALSGSAKEKTVKKFARAPVGCTTTLEFDKAATFTIYIETKGAISSIDGDCAASGTTYRRGNADVPQVSLTLLNSADQESVLTATSSPNYAAGQFAGQAYQRVAITEPGTYRLTVTSDDTDFAIAVGGKPDADAKAMSLAGVGAATIGVVLGGLLILLGLRRKKSRPQAPGGGPNAMWQPTPISVPAWQPQATFTPTSPTATAPTATAPAAPTAMAPPTSAPTTGPGWGAPQQ